MAQGVDVLLRKWFLVTNPQPALLVLGLGESSRGTTIMVETNEAHEETKDELEGEEQCRREATWEAMRGNAGEGPHWEPKKKRLSTPHVSTSVATPPAPSRLESPRNAKMDAAEKKTPPLATKEFFLNRQGETAWSYTWTRQKKCY